MTHRFRPVIEYDDVDGLPYAVMVQDPEGIYVTHTEFARVCVQLANWMVLADELRRSHDDLRAALTEIVAERALAATKP